MIEISMSELELFMQKGRYAAQYAWEHYDELSARKAKFTLYGPEAYGVGAGMPGKFVPQSVRKLMKQTRRKNYLVYELDDKYQLLRTVLVQNNEKVLYTYQCFELDGTMYCCPFLEGEKKMFRDEVLAIGPIGNRPQYLAFLRENSSIVQYFEYSAEDTMFVTTYAYSPTSIYSAHGYPVDCSAPIGALNSPVNRGCWKEPVAYTDFSQWFRRD